MNVGRTVFAQVMDFVPMHEFQRCVNRYDGSYKVQSFSCWDHFLSMAFAQLTYRESLRDIEACLRAQHTKLYHMGLRSKISRSTLSYANNTRTWRIYADFAQVLIATAKELYRDDEFGVDLTNTVYALDSTTIDLCLSLFSWAHFRSHKAAVKLHTLLNLRGNIPSFLHISKGNVHDVNILDAVIPEPGSVYVMDRAYVDFERLYTLTQVFAYFVTRAKSNLQFTRLYSHAVDKTLGTMCDQTIQLTGFYSAQHYPDKLRRIKHYDADTMMPTLTERLSFSRIIFCCRHSLSHNSTSVDGKSNCSSSGSNSISASKPSTAPRRMPSRHKSGSPCRSMCLLRS